MEGLILLGILGAGYVLNEDKVKKNKVHNNSEPPLFQGSGNTIYDMNNVKDAQRYELDMVSKQHNQAMQGDSKIIDSLNMNGRNTLRSDNSGENMIESISGVPLNEKDFLVRDDGIKVEPFFSGSGPREINFDENHGLDRHQGGYHSRREPKREIGPMFQLEKTYGHVYGSEFTGARADQSRYIQGNYRTNELPFEQEKVSHIDSKDEINRDIDLLYAQRNSTESRRTLNNQKLSFGGKVLAGKGINSKREQQSEVFKHLPDKDYVNDADKWLITTGAIDAPLIRPQHDIKDTNRQYLNEGDVGPAAPVIFKSDQERPLFRKSRNQHLVTDTNRNAALEGKQNNNDRNKDSYFVYPNEREITSERTYEGNIKSVFNAKTSDLQDPIKPTIKETTLDDTRNGFVGTSATRLPEQRLQDKAKPTVKDTTNYEYSGNAGTNVPAEMASDQYLRADLNPNKEIIALGRSPTTEKTKLTSGVDILNVDIQKIESDYFNPRINNVDKVYQEIPTDSVCEYTQDKDTLDNIKLSDRLDPTMLDPFKGNPYTQSLSSFA